MDTQTNRIGQCEEGPARIRVGRSDWALLDPADLPWARRYRWYKKEGYAVRYDREGREYRMHRELADSPAERKVWHANGNLLDNRRENLIITYNLHSVNRIKKEKAKRKET